MIGFKHGAQGLSVRPCRPALSQRADGRPGIDPVVYFKMLMVGFFENLPSERAIAARCEDSLAVRAFLGYGLEEATPDHSSLSVIRRRLAPETYQAIFELILKALKDCGLLKGRYVGIDSSVVEANASLKSLVERNTEEAYWDYVKNLARAAGIDPEDGQAVRKFDRKRPGKKLSNEQFKNRHDPDAKISRQKGKTDLIYKPENSVDMDSGAIIQAQLVAADQCDLSGLASADQLGPKVFRATGGGKKDPGRGGRQQLPQFSQCV